MIFEIILMVVGSYALLKGAELITDSSVSIAKKFGTTNLAIGLIFVSVMLSLPELLVSVFASFKGHEQVSVGVSLGSIIVNLGLILGIAALLKPIRIPRHLITRDGIFMLVATLIFTLIALEDFVLTRRDGIVFLLLFIPYVINVYSQEQQLAKREQEKEAESISTTLVLFGKTGAPSPLIARSSLFIFLAGGIVLLIGSELFTRGLLDLVRLLGISEALIGITIGALGPSLPNLTVAFQASRKGFDELAVSQSIGSNIFTIFVTVGILALMKPIHLTQNFASITVPALIIITVVSFLFLLRGKLGRIEGMILIFLYLIAIIAEIFGA